MKKLTGIILLLVMLLCTATAFAASQPGEEVTVTLKFSSPGAYAVTLNVQYDKSVLTYKKSSNNVGAMTGENRISFASLSPISSGTFTYTFTINEDAVAGTYPITLVKEVCTDGDYNPIACTLTGATVTVVRPNCEHEKTTTTPAKAPTCTETGLTEGKTCDLCHKVLAVQSVIPETGHKAVTIKGNPATCSKVGVTDTVKCEICYEVLNNPTILFPKGHVVTMEETGFEGMEGGEAQVRFVFSCCDGKDATISWAYDGENLGVEYLRSEFPEEEPGVLIAVFEVKEAGIFAVTGTVKSSFASAPEVTCPCTIVGHSALLMELPADLTEIRDAAFVNTSAVEYVLPEGLKTIGSRAFADNAELILVNLPEGLTAIAPDAFSNCPLLTILCTENSIGHQFALAQEIPFILIAE